MNKTTFAAAGAILLTARGSGAAYAQSKVSDLDKTFAVTVSQGNNAEVMASKLALKKSSSKKVRMIATMLVKQHGKAQDALMKTAALEKVKLPPGTDLPIRPCTSSCKECRARRSTRRTSRARQGPLRDNRAVQQGTKRRNRHAAA